MGSVPPSSYHRWIRATVVLFPDPLGPTIAVVLFAGMRRVKPFMTLTSCRDGYAKLMFSRTISASVKRSSSLDPVVERVGASMIVKKMDAALIALCAAVNGTETADT